MGLGIGGKMHVQQELFGACFLLLYVVLCIHEMPGAVGEDVWQDKHGDMGQPPSATFIQVTSVSETNVTLP